MMTPTMTDAPNGKLADIVEPIARYVGGPLDMELLKKKVEFAVEDAVLEAQHLAKAGKYAVDDMIEDTAHLIKKNPWQAIGYAAGAGLGVGVFAGWLISRRAPAPPPPRTMP